MYRCHIRRVDSDRKESASRPLSHEAALAYYRQLLARRDLYGARYRAVLRDDISRRTLLVSSFEDRAMQILPDDEIGDLRELSKRQDASATRLTREIIARRRDKYGK